VRVPHARATPEGKTGHYWERPPRSLRERLRLCLGAWQGVSNARVPAPRSRAFFA